MDEKLNLVLAAMTELTKSMSELIELQHEIIEKLTNLSLAPDENLYNSIDE